MGLPRTCRFIFRIFETGFDLIHMGTDKYSFLCNLFIEIKFFEELIGDTSRDQTKGQRKRNYQQGSTLYPWVALARHSFNLEKCIDISIRFLQFPESDFVVMIFHYDGVVDQWRNLTWFDGAIHVSAPNQTKW